MIKNCRIVEIKDYTTDKDGKALTTRDNRPFTRRTIKVEGSDKILSGFKGKENFEIGQEYTLEIEEKEFNGKKYYNWSLPKMENRMMDMIVDLQRRVGKLEAKVFPIDTPAMDVSNTPDFDKQFDDMVDSNEIPF